MTLMEPPPDRPVDGAALAWASRHFPFKDSSLLRNLPWGRTYRLSGAAERAYLKIMPKSESEVARRVEILAREFPHHIPKVTASRYEEGWLLSAEHGGENLAYDSPTVDLASLIRTYAEIQCHAVEAQELLAEFPRPALGDLVNDLVAFLGAKNREPRVAARHFLGDRRAQDYHRSLSRRHALLQGHLEQATRLRATLNHGDLRPPNAALRDDGSCVLFDWDDAFVGPAGMSLHGLFSGCLRPTLLLSEGGASALAQVGESRAELLKIYCDTLVAGGYGEPALLRQSLPAAICAGVIQYIVNFARFPVESDRQRNAIKRSLVRRLDDLLDLCDFLAARDKATTLEYARDYAESGDMGRAEALLREHLASAPEDADVLDKLAIVLAQTGQTDEAVVTLKTYLQSHPERTFLRETLGQVHLRSLNFRAAERELAQVVAASPSSKRAKAALARAKDLIAVKKQARDKSLVPTLAASDSEHDRGALSPEKLELAAEIYRDCGVLQIDSILPPATIEVLRESFFQRYGTQFHAGSHRDALRVGDRRYMLTVDMEAPFDDPDIYASPFVLPLMRRLLGDDCVVSAFTSVISLPGSQDQRLHKDHPPLFPGTPLHHRLPSFAIQMIVPLVALDERVGTTRVVKGSHRVSTEKAKRLPSQDPRVPLGSCLLNDYRVCHQGLGNRSDLVRPILTLIYSRPWFRDHANYSKQPPLRMSRSVLRHMSRDHRRLFSWYEEQRRR